ncbi:hypothetical protein [Trinickia fusca]|uniref:hypothetical protein n=1 Tax=Trinickia fusca TaxID=2419777 RepID=UPI0011C35591|nr:hypothetical protein [Trinickia fusca]
MTDGAAGNARQAQIQNWADEGRRGNASAIPSSLRELKAEAKATARSRVADVPLRRGTRSSRHRCQMGGPKLPAHLPVLILKTNSTALSHYALMRGFSEILGCRRGNRAFLHPLTRENNRTDGQSAIEAGLKRGRWRYH